MKQKDKVGMIQEEKTIYEEKMPKEINKAKDSGGKLLKTEIKQ